MERDQILSEILIQYQKKYTTVTEIYRLTEEMIGLLNHDDRVSTQLILNMRQEEMDRAEECGGALATLKEQLSAGQRQHLSAVLEASDDRELTESWEEKKIAEIYQNTQTVLQKTIELDKRVNLKLAGKDSYYRQNNRASREDSYV
ncbi:MAG: hypothetical protein RSB57_05770 [Hungatella sp.]